MLPLPKGLLNAGIEPLASQNETIQPLGILAFKVTIQPELVKGFLRIIHNGGHNFSESDLA
jgi:hypothetical protein